MAQWHWHIGVKVKNPRKIINIIYYRILNEKTPMCHVTCHTMYYDVKIIVWVRPLVPYDGLHHSYALLLLSLDVEKKTELIMSPIT